MHSFRHNVIERFHSRGHHHLCKIIGTNKESVFIRREFNSHRTQVWNTKMAAFSLFWNTITVRYGHRDVMLKLSIVSLYETSTFYDKTKSCRYISFMPFNSCHIILGSFSLPLPLVQFLPTCLPISRAAKAKNPVPLSFFALKPNGNACYAG